VPPGVCAAVCLSSWRAKMGANNEGKAIDLDLEKPLERHLRRLLLLVLLRSICRGGHHSCGSSVYTLLISLLSSSFCKPAFALSFAIFLLLLHFSGLPERSEERDREAGSRVRPSLNESLLGLTSATCCCAPSISLSSRTRMQSFFCGFLSLLSPSKDKRRRGKSRKIAPSSLPHCSSLLARRVPRPLLCLCLSPAHRWRGMEAGAE
jgi:hypothetical protein